MYFHNHFVILTVGEPGFWQPLCALTPRKINIIWQLEYILTWYINFKFWIEVNLLAQNRLVLHEYFPSEIALSRTKKKGTQGEKNQNNSEYHR